MCVCMGGGWGVRGSRRARSGTFLIKPFVKVPQT